MMLARAAPRLVDRREISSTGGVVSAPWRVLWIQWECVGLGTQPWGASQNGIPMVLKLLTIEIVPHPPESSWSRKMKDGRLEGCLATRSQLLVGDLVPVDEANMRHHPAWVVE